MKGSSIGPFVRVLDVGLLELAFDDTVSDALLDEHFEAFGRYCETNRAPMAMLVRAGDMLRISASQRRRLAEFEARFEEHDRRYGVGVALVSSNAVVRGLITAVFWLKPPVYPHRFFSDGEDAMVWLKEQLDAAER